MSDIQQAYNKERHVRAMKKNRKSIRICRSAAIPDQLRLARYQKVPEYGPRVLFFSGGTALNKLSRHLVSHTHNSIHLTTPFDSGGSSGKLRGPFNVMAVGDMRSRLMALADRTVKGHSDVFDLFSFRLPAEGSTGELRQRLEHMVDGQHPLVARISKPMRDLICNHLRFFLQAMPAGFDLRGASIGNLVLVGGYLNNRCDIESVIFLFSQLVEVRGTVRPTVSGTYHLAVKLQNGSTLVGQHLMTGKEVPPIESSISQAYLTASPDSCDPAKVETDEFAYRLIRKAELICFPMGSFYSSVIANLLPCGIADAIADNDCPKVYIPNTGKDPEQFGMTVPDCVRTLLEYLKAGCSSKATPERLLNYVLIDETHRGYEQAFDTEEIRKQGVDIIETSLISNESSPYLDEEKLVGAILSLT